MVDEHSPQPPDIDALVAQLKDRVAERRRAGLYPPGLEEDLARHFESVAGSMPAMRLDPLLHGLDMASDIGRHRILFDSNVPLGSQLHRLVDKAVTRQTEGLLRQMREFAEATRAVIGAIVNSLPQRDADAALITTLVARVDALEDTIVAMGRGSRSKDTAELSARLERLEKSAAEGEFHPWYSREDFETLFRGSKEQIMEMYRPLAEMFRECSPVVDVGCGQGDVLELFKELGISAHGVDIDAELVTKCVERGLSASAEDGVAYIEALPDHSLGGVFSAQVIEHLPPQRLLDLVAACSQKLRDGGLLVFETINSQSLYVFSHSYYLDPTHVRPVPPLYLEFVLRQAGFRDLQMLWRSPIGDVDRLEEIPVPEDDSSQLKSAVKRNLERLNRTLFADQDYAIAARR